MRGAYHVYFLAKLESLAAGIVVGVVRARSIVKLPASIRVDAPLAPNRPALFGVFCADVSFHCLMRVVLFPAIIGDIA